jgi:hypothetical protein
MYKLYPNFKYNYNVAFIMDFEKHECKKYDKIYPDLIKDWWGHPEKFRDDTHDIMPQRH